MTASSEQISTRLLVASSVLSTAPLLYCIFATHMRGLALIINSFAPLGLALVSAWTELSFREFVTEIGRLEKLKYDSKTA